MAILSKVVQIKGMINPIRQELIGQTMYFRVGQIVVDCENNLYFEVQAKTDKDARPFFVVSSQDLEDSYEDIGLKFLVTKEEPIYTQIYSQLKNLDVFAYAKDA